jgi:hypothetical protein
MNTATWIVVGLWVLIIGTAVTVAIVSRWARRDFTEKFEVKQAEARWENSNAAAKARGCPCGQPATFVRRLNGNVGSVPVEVWSCREHINVNGWVKQAGEEHYSPSADFDDRIQEWQVHAPREEA